ncbi:MAG: T9SS type A sorting domain-containing protein, partial [Bacteroidia bacterium]|nr:T9SS type A sorting domain-containing protein [Bacteroidia bacterium]
NNGNFNVSYLLPQNANGRLEVIDINGRVIYNQYLPQWSTLQNLNLSLPSGIYALKLSSKNYFTTKRFLVQKQ